MSDELLERSLSKRRGIGEEALEAAGGMATPEKRAAREVKEAEEEEGEGAAESGV